jgi:urea carboxylase system permease
LAATDNDSRDLAQFGYKQELDRSLGSFSSFAAGFSYLSILTGMFQTSFLGFAFAGPAFIWAWLFVFFGQLMVALQFAELAAHFPIAGSVYQWSKQVASKAVAWHVGWFYVCCQIVTVPAVALAYQVILPQISADFQIVDLESDGGFLTDPGVAKNAVILGSVLIVFTTIINVIGVRLMATINNIGVGIELVTAVAVTILLLTQVTRGPGDVLGETFDTGVGHDWGYFGALLIGAYMGLYVMYGFDTAGALAEETNDPRKVAPPSILRALYASGIMGFLMILFGAMAISNDGFNAETLGAGGLTAITIDVFGSTFGKIILGLVVVAITVCCLAIHAAAVRMIFAMSRDNYLPGSARLAKISETARVPRFPAVLVGVIGILILLFNIVNPKAFTVIISCGIIWMYCAYIGTTVPLLKKRLAGWPGAAGAAEGYFRLGKWAIITNVLAIVYGASMIINLAWPRVAFYGDLWYQKWGVAGATVSILVIGFVLYHGYQKNQFGVLDEHRAEAGAAAD